MSSETTGPKSQVASLTADDYARLETLDAEALVRFGLERFGQRIAIASSFGLEDVVLIDLAARTGIPFRVFTLDTGRLNQETYDLIDRVRNRYDVDIEILFPDPTEVEPMVTAHGPNLFYDSIELRKRCCHVRKVAPLQRVLSTLNAWMTGLRRDQNTTRTLVPKVEVEELTGRLKLSPLADWTWDAVRAWVRENRVPYSVLHDRGYPSVGCGPCTRAVSEGEDLRAGRWWWENPETKECGLHVR